MKKMKYIIKCSIKGKHLQKHKCNKISPKDQHQEINSVRNTDYCRHNSSCNNKEIKIGSLKIGIFAIILISIINNFQCEDVALDPSK